MLAGKRACHGDTPAVRRSSIGMRAPPDLSATNRQIPPGLDRIVRHCLEKNPEQRFRSAHDLAFDLEALSDISASSPVPHTIRPKPAWRSRIKWLIAGLAALLAAVAGVAILQSPRARTIDSLAVLPFVNAS